MKGKAVAGKHVKQKGGENEVSTVSMDYFYFIKAEEESERGPPSIAIIDGKSGMLRSAVLKQKGVEEWSIQVVKNFNDILGHRKIILRTDNGNSIMALRTEVKQRSHVEIIPEQPPAYDSKTAGKAENAVQRIEKQFITLRDALQTRIDQKIESGHPVVEFLVMHTSDTLNRYHIGTDGRTNYQRWKGKSFKRVDAEFGESELYLRLCSLMQARCCLLYTLYVVDD